MEYLLGELENAEIILINCQDRIVNLESENGELLKERLLDIEAIGGLKSRNHGLEREIGDLKSEKENLILENGILEKVLEKISLDYEELKGILERTAGISSSSNNNNNPARHKNKCQLWKFSV